MEIINRTANMRSDICYKIASNGKICDVSKNDVEMIIRPFNLLRDKDKDISNIEDLNNANLLARKNSLVRVRKIDENNHGNSGYVLISSLTCIGTLIVALIIFMTVKYIVLG